MSLYQFPLTIKQANELIVKLHRHHKPVRSHRFSLGCRDREGIVHGAVVVGRPVSRELPAYEWAEVTRLVTDGHKNACSFLYAAAARVCREMGFLTIQTYVLEDESGTTLLAAGWVFDGLTKGGDWNTPARGGRRTDQPMVRKRRWKKELNRCPS